MLTINKRYPALTDEDKMPFGKYEGCPMMDIPASYLIYMKGKLGDIKNPANLADAEKSPLHQLNTLKFFNYIHNSWEAIRQEEGKE